MELSSFTQTEERTLDFGAQGTLELTITPGSLTPRLISDLSSDEGVDPELIVEGVLAIVKKWDLTNNGKAVKLTKESLMDVPLVALVGVIKGLSDQTVEEADEEGKG